MDKKYLMTAFGYAILGMLLGIYMAASKNHIQHVTHAHILLIGFVVTFAYAVCYKLWLSGPIGRLGQIQFYCHQLGTLVIVICLFLLYGRHVSDAILGPILGVASIAVLAGVVLMKVKLIKAEKTPARPAEKTGFSRQI